MAAEQASPSVQGCTLDGSKNEPLGADDVSDFPQQVMVPSVRIPQANALPAAIAAKVPVGATDSDEALLPQHATVRSDLIAQAWVLPAEIAVNGPVGTGFGALTPQHTAAPVLSRAHAKA